MKEIKELKKNIETARKIVTRLELHFKEISNKCHYKGPAEDVSLPDQPARTLMIHWCKLNKTGYMSCYISNCPYMK